MVAIRWSKSSPAPRVPRRTHWRFTSTRKIRRFRQPRRPFFVAPAGTAGWEGQNWDDQIGVDVVTLDALIARYGMPSFVKIDTEGSEDAVLRGLSSPVGKLSFEFTTIARDVAMACFERLSMLGDYRYNLALGESQRLIFDRWLPAAQMAEHISNLPHEANSGDVYAALRLPLN